MNIFLFVVLIVSVQFLCSANPAQNRIEPRVIGGREAIPHEYPFVVALFLPSVGVNCGGVILSEKWILTAGHCIENYAVEVYEILVGKHDISVPEEGQQVRNAVKFIVHQGFNPYQSAPNDFGLIELDHPLTFSKTVSSIALPVVGSNINGEAIVMGWGMTSPTNDELPNRLQAATVQILPYETCSALLTDANYDESNICTGPLIEPYGSCSGDSGSALVQKDEYNNFTIVGIVSWAPDPCGRDHLPPVLGNVAYVLDWIKANIN